MDGPTSAAQADSELPFELSSPTVSKWVDELPVLNTIQTAEKLYRALLALNKLEIEPPLHFEVIEQLKNTVYLLSSALEKHFLNSSFPLPKRELKLAKLATHLHRELSANYTQITKNSAFQLSESFPPLRQATTIKRALFSLTQEQYLIALRYEACSTRFWTQFYELLVLAEQLHFLAPLDRGDTQENDKSQPIELLAKRLLLFSLSNPNRFSQYEIKELQTLFEHHAELAQLDDQPTGEESKKAGFFLALGSPLPPQHISRLDSVKPTIRYLHTNSLVEHLIDQFKALLSNEGDSCLVSSKRMLGKVVRSLGAPERRKSKRTQSESSECTIISGLENIISFLSKTANNKQSAKRVEPVKNASELWSDIPDYGIMPLDDNNFQVSHFKNSQRDENVANSTLLHSKKKITNSEIWGNQPPSSTETTPLDCKILDISTKGFHLLWAKEANAKIKVGEIISISQPDKPMKTGVIRWIEQDRESGLSFGIELLSPLTQAVTASSPKQPDSEVKALLIPELPEAGIQLSLLVSPSKYRTGGWIDLKYRTTTRHYRLQKLLETSPSFNQFTLFKLDKDE